MTPDEAVLLETLRLRALVGRRDIRPGSMVTFFKTNRHHNSRKLRRNRGLGLVISGTTGVDMFYVVWSGPKPPQGRFERVSRQVLVVEGEDVT